ncbi:MAG: DUF4349 domain-containing protein [Pseudonocardiales bacterium]|nr:MAG: DUF4349 domain-containing protein [Pseudonocardiales bacterium]
MKRVTLTAGAAALAGVVLLTGCSHSGTARSGGAGVDFGTLPAPANRAAAATAVPGQPAAPGAGGANGSAKSGAGVKVPLSTAALIRTADLAVEVAHGSDVPAQADRAEQIVIGDGGLVFADERTAGTVPAAALTLKVPGPSLVSVLDKLSTLGKEKSRRSSTQDVTTQVADVSSRVRSAQASIDRLRLLFGQATKVGDVIALESELAQREADLESLQAQQRTLAGQTEMATVTLNLSAAAATAGTPKHHAKSGFLGGLDRGWRAFTSAAGALATGIGAVLPFLVLALLIAGGVAVLRRRTRSARPPVIAPPDPA